MDLNENYTFEELKKAYRIRSKQLHPDKNQDNLNSHLAMIRLNQAYSNLLKSVDKKTSTVINTQVEDTAYSFYSDGIRKFQNIHPSRWKKFSKAGLFDAGAVATSPDTPSIIQSLITVMAEAYHCFSIVINEHENSPWYSDSLMKMKEIEKLTQRYLKIKESYESESVR